MKNAQITSW